MSWINDFKTFLLRGNVVDTAIGVIIGIVFGNVVNSLVNDIIMPPLGLLLSGIDFSKLSLTPGPPRRLFTHRNPLRRLPKRSSQLHRRVVGCVCGD